MQDRRAATIERAMEWAARDDTYLTPESVGRYFETGQWGTETLTERFEGFVAQHPDKPVFIDQAGNRTTYAQLRDMAYGFGAALVELGFRHGDNLIIQLPNWVELAAATLGAARVGVVPAFANMGYRPHELRHLFGIFNPKGYLCVGEMRGYDFVAGAKALQQEMPNLQQIVTVRTPAIEGTSRFDDLVAQGAGKPLPEQPLSTDLFCVMPTSGTTGRPKGVMMSHATILAATDQYASPDELGWGRNDHWLNVAPMTHFMGLAVPFVLGALGYGGSATLQDGWDPAKALELIERDKVTSVLCPPVLYYSLLREPTLATRDHSSIRYLAVAGAPCPVPVLEQLGATFPKVHLQSIYGSTEMLLATCTRFGDSLEAISTSVGRPGAALETKLVDEQGSEVPVGAQGELWGRGRTLALGYYRDPEATHGRFLGDWFRTQDLLTKRPDGNLVYNARVDDMINRGAFKIDPREIEEVLVRHPKVGQVAIVGLPDPALGQRVLAHVVARESGNAPTLEELRSHLEEQGVAKVKWPEGLVLHEALPMTQTGKVLRYQLREIAIPA